MAAPYCFSACFEVNEMTAGKLVIDMVDTIFSHKLVSGPGIRDAGPVMRAGGKSFYVAVSRC